MFARRSPGRIVQVRLFDRAKLERPLVGHKAPQFDRNRIQHIGRQVREVFQAVRLGNLRHIGLMRQAVLRNLKRRRQVEYRPTVLNGDHASIGKTTAVAGPVNVVNDRCVDVTATQEIAVQ